MCQVGLHLIELIAVRILGMLPGVRRGPHFVVS